MTVRTTKRTDEDIINLFVDGAARFGSAQAERYHDGLHRLFDLLDANPRMARLRTEFSPPMRLHRYRAHVILYVVDESDVLIIRVLYGRQNWEQGLL